MISVPTFDIRRGLLAFIALFISQLCNAQSFYAVLVADTKDPSLGASCEKDLQEMSGTLQAISKKIQYNYQELICHQDQFGKGGIQAAISKIQCKPEDIIFFYYTGHGINTITEKSDFPILYLKDENLELETVHKLLKEKKPRFCLTLGDCCNNLFAGRRGMRSATPVLKGIGVTQDTQILRKLFVEANGDLLISSAKKGERATAHPSEGSFYSNTWMQALAYAENHNMHVSWETLLADAENRLQESLKSLPDSLKHHSQWVRSFPEPVLPCPEASFTEINRFLNVLADEKLGFNERNKLRILGQKGFFGPTAQVSIYMSNPEKPVETQPIDHFLKRIVNTAPLIDEFNFVERLSTLGTGCTYDLVTLQEIRKAK
ncbi:Caspase domain-containing protein [Dyadobacter sp. SG02]|uniref:caspase family protein n=1 Tax=Dyadobacter sp. SG02 TaxID=1855291 RepID=UPI0008B9826E|nr:caspase family protein [Dyadobacter sp. SG02]SEJ84997.1 Caspase domain-containing protein [Dyadobacter sp. SG02]